MVNKVFQSLKIKDERRSQEMKKALCLVLAVVITMMSSSALAELPTWKILKDFKVKTMDGETFELYKTLEEKEMVLIDLWFVDCEPCAEAAAGIQGVYDEYKDRVGFISINPFDREKDIELYTTSRGLTYPCARNSIGSKWTDMYPHFILVKKGGMVVYSDIGVNTPARVRALLEEGLALTDEDIQKYVEMSEEYGSLSVLSGYADDWNEQVKADLQCYVHVYNIMNNMALQVDSPGIKKIVVDDNLKILQCNEMAGEFYIVPENAQVSVTVKTEKGFKSNKATVFDWDTWEYTPFKKAKKDKDDYIFEFSMENTARKHYTYFASENIDMVTRDSYVGLVCLNSEEEAKRYFEKVEKEYGYQFPWHVE